MKKIVRISSPIYSW